VLSAAALSSALLLASVPEGLRLAPLEPLALSATDTKGSPAKERRGHESPNAPWMSISESGNSLASLSSGSSFASLSPSESSASGSASEESDEDTKQGDLLVAHVASLHEAAAAPSPAPKRYLVFTSAGDKSNLACWLANGPRNFDLWVTYYGQDDACSDAWRGCASEAGDVYRRRQGGKFENLASLWRDEPALQARLERYDGVWVADDDIVIDAPRINALFEVNVRDACARVRACVQRCVLNNALPSPVYGLYLSATARALRTHFS
jgi:hypothetical protein